MLVVNLLGRTGHDVVRKAEHAADRNGRAQHASVLRAMHAPYIISCVVYICMILDNMNVEKNDVT